MRRTWQLLTKSDGYRSTKEPVRIEGSGHFPCSETRLAPSIIFCTLLCFGLFIAAQEAKAVKLFGGPQTITLMTRDGKKIVGDYVEATGAQYAGILVPSNSGTKRNYQDFAQALSESGFASVSLDLRGRGQSSGGPEGFRKFSDDEHSQAILDLEAAAEFLQSRGFDLKHQFLVGASIGANLSLQFIAGHPELQAAVLLSAGLSSRRVTAQPLIQRLRERQALFLATSEDDGDNSQMTRILYDQVPPGVEKRILVYKKSGHGTSMFGKESPDLANEIISWLKKNLR